jgi:hypothetical protein
VPVARLGDLLRSGQFRADPEARVPVVVGDGSVQTVRARDLGAALDQGWQVASSSDVATARDRDHYESVGAQSRAAGEAAARGITLGLSDLAMVKLGVDPEGLRKRKELNPVISGAGEIAGAAAPLLLTGGAAAPLEGGALGIGSAAIRGAGVLPRALAATGRAVEGGLGAVLGDGVLARGTASLASGAAEGGLYGLGQAVSESALQDAPLTAERVLAHMGSGALFGGAAGGVLGTTAASMEQQLLPKLKSMLSVEKIEAFVDRAGLRQWAQGRGKTMFKKLRRDFGDDAEATIGRAIRDEGLNETIANGATWDEIHVATKARLGASGRRIGDTLKAIDEQLPGEANAAAQRIAQRVTTDVLEPLTKTGLRSDKGLANKIFREAEGLFPTVNAGFEQTAPLATFEQLQRLRARIDDLAFPKGAADPTPYQKALQKVRGVMEDEITSAADAAAEKIGGGLAANYSSEKLRYKALKWLNDAAENNAASELANRTVSLTDNLWGSAMTAATFSRLLAGDVSALGSMALATFAGVGSAMANKFLREQGQGLAARTGEKVLSILRAHDTIGHETESAVTKLFEGAGRARDAAQITAPVLVLRAGGEKLPQVAERYEKKRDEVLAFAQAPDQRLARLLGDTPTTAPNVAAEVRATAMRANEFLQSKLPIERNNPYDPQPLLRKGRRPKVSDSEAARFLRYAEAVERPRETIKKLGEGKVRREHAEALRVVYPRLYQDVVQHVESKLASSKTPLPRQKLVQLSILLDRPLHPTMAPEFIARSQAVHQKQRQATQQRQGASMSGGSKNGGEPYTESQRLEA